MTACSSPFQPNHRATPSLPSTPASRSLKAQPPVSPAFLRRSSENGPRNPVLDGPVPCISLPALWGMTVPHRRHSRTQASQPPPSPASRSAPGEGQSPDGGSTPIPSLLSTACMVGGGPGPALPPHPAHLSGKQVGAPVPWLLMQSRLMARGCSERFPSPPSGPTCCIQSQTLASNLIAFLGDPTALPHSGLCNLHVQILNKAV